jgi:uroporphyrinogen decarboxylase
MNENLLPDYSPIKTAEDWKRIRPINVKDKLVQDQLDIIKRITDELKGEAVILTTIHGLVASTFHSRGGDKDYDERASILPSHLRENPEIFSRALEIVAEGLVLYARASLEAGAEGIYYAALGGEMTLFTDEEHKRYIKPNELMILDAIKDAPAFNVLHICRDYVNLNRFRDYNPKVVNWAVHANNPGFRERMDLFPGAAILGGLDDQAGVLVEGSEADIENAVFSLLDKMGTEKMIIGADCTLPTSIEYRRIRTAVEAAGKYSKA